VITARFADTGALICRWYIQLFAVHARRAAGRNLETAPCLTHSRIGCRADSSGRPGEARVQALNQDFVRQGVAFRGFLDRQTRTMETEIDFDNRDGRLIPGMYAETQLSLREKKYALTVHWSLSRATATMLRCWP